MVNEFGNNSLQPKCSNINAENISEKTNFDEQNNDEDSLSSESDALIIDETIRRKITTTTTNQNKKKQQPAVVRKKIFSSKLVDKKAAAAAENPFFNASLFELTETHENKRKKPPISRQKINNTLNTCSLQPNIQFKCPRCHLNGFETLPMLQQHFQTCCSQTTDGAATTTTTTNSSTKTSTGGVIYPSNSNAGTAASFKLTRKVFLCSACGTYYENWNLYVHMREFHRRFICLYCLGMFRQLDDLCEHIQGRHHQRAGHRTTPTDFYQVYREPCYVICCQCQRQFSSELDDAFFYHQCHHLETTTTTTTQKNRCQIEMTAVSSVISPPASPDEHVATVPEVVAPSVVQQTDYNVEMDAPSVAEMAIDTRKVPKLSLKLPKFINKNDVEDEEEEEEEFDEEEEEEEEDEEKLKENDKKDEELVEKEEQEEVEEEQTVEFSVAGVEVAIKKLELDRPLDKIPIRELLQHCLNATIATCIFCNHARRIAVNGRQLAVHAISEHRFAAVNKSITEEELSPESFNSCLRAGLDDLSMSYFNLELSNEQQRPLFECFQCYFKTHAHKELYLHNRKFHSKSSLLCIMCKTNFYTYSELVSHLCAGNYDPGAQQSRSLDMRFRCALCAPIGDSTSLQLELPSAFRLMCHLRKRHATCDVCLENCHTQMALSNHVWKHKLHHFCYRCAIAYRNKPDITRHLFWKHGTESVTCQRCLQKKWSHVYHFCVPPALFECDICHVTQVHSAQALRVHKRLHTQEFKHQCQFDVDTCHEAFISRKLMLKHVQRCHVDEQHFDDKIEEIDEEEEEENLVVDKMVEEEAASPEEKVEIKNDEVVEVSAVVAPPPVVKVDVLDLPELNLSEESSSDDSSCDEETKRTTSDTVKMAEIEQQQQEDEEEKRHLENEEILENPPQIVENLQLIEGATSSTSTVINMNDIWENFKNYQQEKSQKLQFPGVTTAPPPVMEKSTFFDIPIPEVEVVPMDTAITDLPPPDVTSWALTDHDYCKPDELPSTSVMDDKIVEMQPQLEESELLVQMSATTTDGAAAAAAAAAEEQRYDHDYCSPRDGGQTAVKSDNIKVEEEAAEVSIAKKTSSSSNNSSNSSSSSSCECGSSCSCSDSSDDDDDTSETATAASQMSTSSQNGSSDSSTAEGRKRQLEARMRKRKMRGKALKLEKKQKKQQQQLDNSASSLVSKNETNNDNTAQKIGKKMTDEAAVTTTTTKVSNKIDRKQKCQIINESDLETSETETDEEFYDREPQKMALLLRQQQEEEDKLRVAQLLLLSSSSMTNNNDIDISRPLTPPPEDGVTAELTSSRSRTSNRKKKNKKRRKNADNIALIFLTLTPITVNQH